MRAARLAGLAVAATVASVAAAQGGVSSVQPLPQSFCSPTVQGSAEPQYLIVSDFPLRFFPFKSKTLQFQAAMRYELKRRHFTAGKYIVGYQACDDSSPQAGSGALSKCASNARAYARDASVIGVVGTWNSSCSAAELPTLNQAPNGPLALVSPTNTDVGLTHAALGTAPDEPGRYYPTGKRSYVRIISPDDAQGVAAALLAKKLGSQRVFVLNDGSGYGLDVAGAFRRPLGAIGLKLAGTGTWSPDQTNFDALAAQVATASPDAVFLGGGECSACADLVKAVRAALGAGPAIIVPDGFSANDMVKGAGAAADGLYASVPGLPLTSLPPEGRKIERLFGPPRLGSGGPSYAAQAVDVLLDAIAASDGTRASVASHLLSVSIRSGIIGSFRFGKNGDPTFNPIMIFRVGSGGKIRLDRVVVPPPSMVR